MTGNVSVKQTSLVRVGLGKETAFFVAGVVAAATAFKRIRRRRLRSRKSAPAGHTIQAQHNPDASQDWVSSHDPVPAATVAADQLLLLDEELPLTPKQVWRLIYDMTFIQAFYSKKNYREIGIGGWQKTGPNSCTKSAHYITPVKKNVIGPREAYTEEEYLCQTRGPTGFVVKVWAYTRQVPYGKSFHVEMTWTASRVSSTASRLQVVGTFVPEKRMFGVGSIIKKAAHEGLQDTYSLYRQHLLDSLPAYAYKGGQAMSPGASTTASRTASAYSKEAAEELIRNGVFVSWGQLLWAILVLGFIIAGIRLAVDKEAQERTKTAWGQEWQRALALVYEFS